MAIVTNSYSHACDIKKQFTSFHFHISKRGNTTKTYELLAMDDVDFLESSFRLNYGAFIDRDWTIEQEVNNFNTLNFTLCTTQHNGLELEAHDQVKVIAKGYGGEKIIFLGQVENMVPESGQENIPYKQYQYEVHSITKRLTETIVTRTWHNKSIKEIISDVWNTWLTGNINGFDKPTFTNEGQWDKKIEKFSHEDSIERLIKILVVDNEGLWWGQGFDVFFSTKQYAKDNFTYIPKEEDIGVKRSPLSFEIDASKYANQVKFKCKDLQGDLVSNESLGEPDKDCNFTINHKIHSATNLVIDGEQYKLVDRIDKGTKDVPNTTKQYTAKAEGDKTVVSIWPNKCEDATTGGTGTAPDTSVPAKDDSKTGILNWGRPFREAPEKTATTDIVTMAPMFRDMGDPKANPTLLTDPPYVHNYYYQDFYYNSSSASAVSGYDIIKYINDNLDWHNTNQETKNHDNKQVAYSQAKSGGYPNRNFPQIAQNPLTQAMKDDQFAFDQGPGGGAPGSGIGTSPDNTLVKYYNNLRGKYSFLVVEPTEEAHYVPPTAGKHNYWYGFNVLIGDDTMQSIQNWRLTPEKYTSQNPKLIKVINDFTSSFPYWWAWFNHADELLGDLRTKFIELLEDGIPTTGGHLDYSSVNDEIFKLLFDAATTRIKFKYTKEILKKGSPDSLWNDALSLITGNHFYNPAHADATNLKRMNSNLTLANQYYEIWVSDITDAEKLTIANKLKNAKDDTDRNNIWTDYLKKQQDAKLKVNQTQAATHTYAISYYKSVTQTIVVDDYQAQGELHQVLDAGWVISKDVTNERITLYADAVEYCKQYLKQSTITENTVNMVLLRGDLHSKLTDLDFKPWAVNFKELRHVVGRSCTPVEDYKPGAWKEKYDDKWYLTHYRKITQTNLMGYVTTHRQDDAKRILPSSNTGDVHMRNLQMDFEFNDGFRNLWQEYFIRDKHKYMEDDSDEKNVSEEVGMSDNRITKVYDIMATNIDIDKGSQDAQRYADTKPNDVQEDSQNPTFEKIAEDK